MSINGAMRAALGLLLVIAVQAQGIVLQPFDIPAYQSTKGIELYASRDEYEAATRDSRFRLEKLAYRSANLRVFAYLYSPVQPSGKRPAVIFNRGSFVRDEFAS